MEKTKYYLGLDMGTSSVGWAVTDANYNLLRAKGKDLWGIREFDEALTAVERRTHRTARRRRQREIARIGLLKDYFHDAIYEVDANFYQRMENSKYHLEDKDEEVRTPDGIFHDKNYTDKDYFKQFPTIFHLRKELLQPDKQYDVRLVYLALLNMFKHRGHFLNANLGTSTSERDLETVYQEFCLLVEELLELSFIQTVDREALENILSSREYSRKRKAEELAALLGVEKKDKRQNELIKCICGLKANLKVIYEDKVVFDEEEKAELSFTDSNFQERETELLSLLGEENYNLILCMKEVYDISSLAGMMKGYHYLSEARVAQYEKHHNDLVLLKQIIKKHCSMDEYQKFFKGEDAGTYGAYVNSNNSGEKTRRNRKGRSREELYALIKKYIKGMPQDDENVCYILQEMEKENFLPKQLTASNGVIPYQIHAMEMQKILQNAEQYLPFLLDKDESGLTVSERILQLFSFQIPYYVGPVTENSRKNGGNGWVVRKEAGMVLPWNIESKIDLKKTSEEFISRMVRHCTYLSGERVLPKSSLMYERFCVLNELNNVRVRGEKLPIEIKQDIYHDLFEKGKKVTKNQLCRYLLGRGILMEGEKDQIGGMDDAIHSSLSTYGKFYSIFGDKMQEDKYREMVEEIVFWCTVYGDSKKFLREQLVDHYTDELSAEQIKRIMSFRFKDWGNLSKSFLQLQGCSKETGEVMPLLGMMWETNDNLMELLADDRYTYREELDNLQKNAYKPLAEMTPEDLDDMYFSAPVKRMVWQTLLIIKEIEKIMGCPPERLFVEMTRKEDEEKQRKESRKQKFLTLYKSIKEESRDWKKIIEDADGDGTLRSKKMYLYLSQMGRCMYTGNPIDLDKLFDNNLYDIDHIYPRHFVKDDNIANNLVLVEKEKNAHKSDNYPLENSIYTSQLARWRMLHDKHFISDEKFKRLTGRNSFTDEQKAGFIARQLVETSQGTKGVTAILKEALPNTTIVYAKASNVSEFRQTRKLLKTRLVNDFHHAQDAYLNIVVGNAYFVKFTQNPLHFIRKEYSRDMEKNHYNLSKMFDWDIKRGNEVAWVAQNDEEAGTIVTVKKVMSKNTPLLTRLSFERYGGIAKETLYSAKKASKEKYIPLKSKDAKMQNVEKYGGFGGVKIAYFFLVEHELKGKRIRTIETVPIYLKSKLENDKNALHDYCINTLGLQNPDIRMAKIKIQSLVKRNGYYVHLSTKSGKRITVRNAVEMCLEQKWANYIKSIEKESGYEKSSKEENEGLYDILVEKHLNGIFSRRPNPLGEKLRAGKQNFVELNIDKQCKVLLEVLKLSQIGLGIADTTLIGGSPGAGEMRIADNIMDSEEFILINQSVTGIYESRVNLLTV